MKLRKRIKELEGGETTTNKRRLSALNRFKKEILKPITDEAIAESGFSDLISIDKIRLLNRVYPILWNNLILEPLYREHNLTTDEEQNKFKNNKKVQNEYNRMVDQILEEMNSGELDDQQHYKEDLTSMFIQAIEMAAKTFDEVDYEE